MDRIEKKVFKEMGLSPEEINKIDNERKGKLSAKEIEDKINEKVYITPNHVFSYNNKGITEFVYMATRGVGKSVIAMETAIILKRKYGYENVKVYYFRLKKNSINALLANNAKDAVDPYLIHKYDMFITRKGNCVYDHGKPLFEAYSLSESGSMGKGVNFYDCEFFKRENLIDQNGKIKKKHFAVTIWDEFIMAEGVEKRSIGNPVSQYRIYREAIFRDAERITEYNCAYNFLLANNVGEAAGTLGALYNYIPYSDNHNRTILTRKHCFVWNIRVTNGYVEKRKKSINATIMDYVHDSNYAMISRDLSCIKPKNVRLRKVSLLIKFDRDDTQRWFCIYDGKYIRKYNGETVNKNIIFGMTRHLDEIYDDDLTKQIIENYDYRAYDYADVMSMGLFVGEMKILKAK